MFPTRTKTKISSSLAYPANAKLISEALADVPQAQDLSISFLYWQSTARFHECSMPYPVMAVEYSYRKASQYTPHHSEEAGMNQPRWVIWVQPVPSTLKHHVKELLQHEALPKLQAWLLSKQNLTGKQETQSLTVWYDEARDELQYGEHQHP
jgi:hypothetical protein